MVIHFGNCLEGLYHAEASPGERTWMSPFSHFPDIVQNYLLAYIWTKQETWKMSAGNVQGGSILSRYLQHINHIEGVLRLWIPWVVPWQKAVCPTAGSRALSRRPEALYHLCKVSTHGEVPVHGLPRNQFCSSNSGIKESASSGNCEPERTFCWLVSTASWILGNSKSLWQGLSKNCSLTRVSTTDPVRGLKT